MTETPTLFDPAALRAYVNKAFAAVPPHHGCARLKVTLPDGRVEFVMAARVSEHWMIQGGADWKIGTKDWSAKLEVDCSW